MPTKNLSGFQNLAEIIKGQSFDDYSYDDLKELKKDLLDEWVNVREGQVPEPFWMTLLERIDFQIDKMLEKEFSAGNVKWHCRGGFSERDVFVFRGIDLSKPGWESVDVLPNDMVPPSQNKRTRISLNKTTVEKSVYFGHEEVSNGIYCYWVAEPE